MTRMPTTFVCTALVSSAGIAPFCFVVIEGGAIWDLQYLVLALILFVA